MHGYCVTQTIFLASTRKQLSIFINLGTINFRFFICRIFSNLQKKHKRLEMRLEFLSILQRRQKFCGEVMSTLACRARLGSALRNFGNLRDSRLEKSRRRRG